MQKTCLLICIAKDICITAKQIRIHLQMFVIKAKRMGMLALSYSASLCALGKPCVFLNKHLQPWASTPTMLILFYSSTIFFNAPTETKPRRSLNWDGLKLCNTTLILFLKKAFISVSCNSNNACIFAQLVSKFSRDEERYLFSLACALSAQFDVVFPRCITVSV